MPNSKVISTQNTIPGPSKSIELPFFPAFTIQSTSEGVTIFWFERDFSQTTYGYRPESGRHACVLIVLLTASKIAQNIKAIHLKNSSEPHQKVNYVTIKCLAEAILQGIDTYSILKDEKRLLKDNLTIPEAYQGLGGQVGNIHEWKSFIYAVDMAENLHNCLLEGIHVWNFRSLAKKDVLFVILIADVRAVLIVIDQIEDKLTFLDPHPHSQYGACIATIELSEMKPFCRWIGKLFKDTSRQKVSPQTFELSYFQVKAR